MCYILSAMKQASDSACSYLSIRIKIDTGIELGHASTGAGNSGGIELKLSIEEIMVVQLSS
jgi:hypothetical protein